MIVTKSAVLPLNWRKTEAGQWRDWSLEESMKADDGSDGKDGKYGSDGSDGK